MHPKQPSQPLATHGSAAAKAALHDHRCYACLIGPSAKQRACALRALLSEGFSDALIRSSTPSLKTEH